MQINHILQCEKLRDGGSLIVSFQSNDSCEYWIMFPVVNKNIENREFGNPMLINRTSGIEINLSLASTKQWLRNLESYFEQRLELPNIDKQSEIDVFNKMLRLCQVST